MNQLGTKDKNEEAIKISHKIANSKWKRENSQKSTRKIGIPLPLCCWYSHNMPLRETAKSNHYRN